MTERTRRWAAPAEVKIVCGVFTGVALAYILLATIIVTTSEASGRTLLMPVTSLILGGLVVAGLLLKMPAARFAGLGVAALLGLLHAFTLLAAEMWLMKIFSILAVVGYIYAGVLCNSMPLRRFLLGAKA